MSWATSGHGKRDDVIATAKKDFEAYKCIEPEETVRQAAFAAIIAALEAQHPEAKVTLHASGHQTQSGQPPVITNTLHISVEPR